MINLPAKFAAENARAEKVPAVIVKLLDSELANEQTTLADWQANSAESNVDYTPEPPTSGDVILASASVPLQENLAANSWGVLAIIGPGGVSELNEYWQSFKNTTSTTKTLNTVKVYVRQSIYGTNIDYICEIWSAGKGSAVSPTKTLPQLEVSTNGQWITFDFSADNVLLSSNTEYWIRILVANAHPVYVQFDIRYWNADIYSNGQLDRTGSSPATNLGDLTFSLAMTGSYYVTSGFITTQTMDLGSVPTVPGELILKDIRPAGTSIVYEAWGSDTGAFAGEETYYGVVVDGQVIPSSALRRYYRVKASLSTTDKSFTPTLQSIKASFATYASYADTVGFGYEPAVLGISSLTTTIDTFKPSTIGQMTIKLAFIKSLSDWLKTKYPKNKIVKILVGFKAEGFKEVDFIDYFWGQVDDWAISTKDEVSLVVKDYKKEWDIDVPPKWASALDDVTWTAMHPVDVILDLLRNHINVQDSKIDISSFDILRSALPGWQVTRTITKEPEKADALIEELRVLMSAYFIPKADGKISIKRWDPNEAAVVSLTDVNTFNKKWSANAKSLINDVIVYTNWDGTGDDAANFTDIRIGEDLASKSNYNELASKTIKDKWTRTAQSSQIDDLINQILTRYATPPEAIELRTDASLIAYEVGDLVDLSIRMAPSSDMLGVQNLKMQIVRRDMNFKKNSITFGLLRA